MLFFLKLVFSFYKKFMWFSLVLNFLFLAFEVPLVLAVIYKVFFTLGIFWIYKISQRGEKLIFYNNLKLTGIKLFLISFLYDMFLLIILYLLYRLIL